jgi:MYXO-CTERM domain-containing protein
LTRPGGGTTVNLINSFSFNTGSVGTNFDGTITFDDAAANVANVNPNQPQAGTFRPVNDPAGNALANFNGGTALGTWSLFIQDTVGQDALRFRSYTLTVTTQDAGPAPAPEPEPSTLVGGALGALVVVAYVRRRRRRTEVSVAADR